MVTVAEAAKLLGHKWTSRIYSLITMGKLKAKEVDGKTMIAEDSLEAYKANRRTAGSKKKAKVKKTKTTLRAVPKPSQKKKVAEEIAV